MAVKAVCAACGESFTAQRSTARYCSETCKKRAQRAPVASDGVSGLLATIQDQLRAAGRLETVPGQQALEVARQMTAPRQSGSAVAALSKELRALMAEAMKGVAVVADPVDELRRRRDAKRSAG